MDAVNRTLYIPLYGKAAVSSRGILLRDPDAERIWAAEGFRLHGKAKSKWLAYYMGMRAAVFDDWTRGRMAQDGQALVLHIGCGLDSRCNRVGGGNPWVDLGFPEVIAERRRHFDEGGGRRMLAGDARQADWLAQLPEAEHAIVVMEGVSMYLTREELAGLLARLRGRFRRLDVLMDCYTVFAAKASRWKNPVNTVGARTFYGVDDPEALAAEAGLRFVAEREMTPPELVGQLRGFERWFFAHVMAGGMAKKIYRLYEMTF